jgi:hypothetical protein
MEKSHLRQSNPVGSYERSVHGKAATEGVRDAPVCGDRHGEDTPWVVNRVSIA